MHFRDRAQAGLLLAAKLHAYRARHDVIVFALPRGGVVVGYEVAAALQAPLDVVVVRKVGLPGFSEMAIGALAFGGVESISSEAVKRFRVSPEALQNIVTSERRELGRQELLFRDDMPFPEVRDNVVILVDDGLATGQTMRAAITAVRSHAPREIVVAVPVGAPETCRQLSGSVDHVICLFMPEDFAAVGAFYEDFRQVDDGTVISLLQKANENVHGAYSAR